MTLYSLEVAKDYAAQDPGTLLIFTADHETGSLAIEDTNEIQSDPAYSNESGEARSSGDGPFTAANSGKKFLVDWTTTNHTTEDVPVTAMGPGGDGLVGVYENPHIHDARLNALFGSTAASASASASSSSASPQPPDTGGISPVLPLSVLLIVGGLMGAAVVVRTRRT